MKTVSGMERSSQMPKLLEIVTQWSGVACSLRLLWGQLKRTLLDQTYHQVKVPASLVHSLEDPQELTCSPLGQELRS